MRQVTVEGPKDNPIPPLMRKLLTQYAATGLPPAYIPKHEHTMTQKKANKEENNDE